MTETELEVEYLGGCYNTLNPVMLTNLTHDVMEEVERTPLDRGGAGICKDPQ